jgi:hypothetical protein
MAGLKMIWTQIAKRQFDEFHKRAIDTKHSNEFIKAHNEVVEILADLERATERGDPQYHTKKAGGIVRHFLHRFISVTYCVFAEERVGWVIRYAPVPPSWPEKPTSSEGNGKP